MKNSTKKLVFAAVFLALCLVLPFLTGNNRQLGTLLSLMHIPVLLCGFICGWQYGLVVGLIAPILRSVLFGMPPMPVVAIPMAFELAAYGFLAGLLNKYLPKGNRFVFISMVIAMIGGRLINLAASFLFGTPAILSSLHSLFIGTLPGIVIQMLLIPAVVGALNKARLMQDV